MMVSRKPRKCKACKAEYTPRNSLQKGCSPQCALVLVNADNAKKAKRQQAADKKTLRDNDRGWHLKKAQEEFNRYIRLRDKGEACISCGRMHQGQWHAGHYRSVGAHPELRFDELNCHLQCAPCNNHKSGDIVNYRKNLIHKIGVDALDWLEGPHEPKRYTIADLKEIRAHYQTKAKELEEENGR